MVGVLAATFGAGLRPTELPRAHTSWVVRRGGVTFLEVPGKHARRIPVAEPYAAVLWQVKADHPGEMLLGERNSRNALNDPLSSLEYGPATPKLDPGRGRSTWILRRMAAATPLPVVAEAAGLTSIETFADLLPHLPPVSRTAATRWLLSEPKGLP